MQVNEKGIKTGWAQADITPDRKVLLAGQFYARVSEGVKDPVTATALAVEAVGGGVAGQAVMVSCDLATISDELRDAVRARVRARLDDLDPSSIFIGATHAHSAPDARLFPYGMGELGAEYKKAIPHRAAEKGDHDYGMWPSVGYDVMPPGEYIEFAVERIGDAIERAWKNRRPSGIGYGLGFAVVGRNRRLAYRDGTSKMYGRSDTPDFRHVEGYEDHSVYSLMTFDEDRTLTGIIVNVPCPSQVREHSYEISADYWHETREELRKRFGKHIHILPQCAPAGDQSPHVLIGKKAEARMWRLKDGEPSENAPCLEIAKRIADAVGDILPCAEKEIDWTPAFAHVREVVDLPRRLISEQDVEQALKEAEPFKEEYQRQMDEIEKNPEIRKKPRWYTEVTKAYRRMERGERVRQRLDLQKRSPSLPTELHAIRLGDCAFATNPFELYLDYAVRIRELSKAVQTFLIQKAGCSGTYLPSERSMASGGYGSVPASTDVGPDGGDLLVDWTVQRMNEMW